MLLPQQDGASSRGQHWDLQSYGFSNRRLWRTQQEHLAGDLLWEQETHLSLGPAP